MSKKNKHENEVVEEELLTAEKETTIDETIADIDPLEELKSNLEKEKDRNLRLFAEFENFKKRTSRERIELFSTASEGVMVSLLPVLDDFDRALSEIEKSDSAAHLEGIILINNNGYSMVKQTQDQWLESKYYATSTSGGLSFPNFRNIALSFGLNYSIITNDSSTDKIMKRAYENRKPRIIEVIVDSNQRVSPQSRFGYPIEDSDPMLSRKEFNSNMIIDN